MPAIEVRSASHAEAKILAEIHGASFGDAAWSAEQIGGSLALDTTRGWLAVEQDKPLGFVLCQAGPEEIEILTLAVHPVARRRGVGEMLMKSIKGSGAETIFLEVAADNRAAIRLYEKLGFHKTGGRKDYYRRGAQTVDAVFYEKILSA